MTHTPSPTVELTYCQNIHPAETLDDVLAALRGPTGRVRDAVGSVGLQRSVDFPLGLRLSAAAVETLAEPAAMARLEETLATEGYRAVTVNGFPYGAFHGTRIKEQVYQPDWRSDERLDYTVRLAEVMAELAPPGETVSLSTVPGTFKPLAAEAGAVEAMAERLLRATAHLPGVDRRTGRTIALALEPEPFCFLETIDEAVAFFDEHLFSDGAVRRFADLTALSIGEAATALPRHLGLCYDVCHAAVEFEEPVASLEALRRAGVPIHKLQLSSALAIDRVDAEARRALTPFDEPTYLHQVVARRGDRLTRYADLPEALARGAETDGEEWRVHFHVPIFVERLEHFGTTQQFLREILHLHRGQPISRHLEVETYTWDVLPESLHGEPVEAAIARELEWVREQLE